MRHLLMGGASHGLAAFMLMRMVRRLVVTLVVVVVIAAIYIVWSRRQNRPNW